jgi:hypothetical protein
MAMISVLGEWLMMSAREFSQRDSGTSDASEPEAVEAVKSAQRVERKAVCGAVFPFLFSFKSQFN